MPSEAPLLPTQTEKPNHYSYLKEFRTQQCPLFLQHKCTQHRPFTCFHWHFMNQRRRRPIRKRDGTFNYSPDQYCTKYDETTGICPEGDECPFLHRTAGDTERRYHLRYYKTSVCVHETDSKGHCIKNGPHCAFAHGARDLRPSVHDVREMQDNGDGMGGNNVADSPLGSTVEKDRQINEDPKWNDTNYVLANYKTDPCKRPPRLCRQGYACPSYHNTRDRRRSPKKFKYRSTPCPNVKHGDDWGDPSQCENQDNCPYCHTRTEQQFHPEIYKSSKCNDMVQHGYCPRGPFCAFAHVEQEMTTQRELAAASENSLAAFLSSVLPDSIEDSMPGEHENGSNQGGMPYVSQLDGNTNGGSFFSQSYGPLPMMSALDSIGGTPLSSSFPEPIGKGRAGSFSSMMSDGGMHVPLSKAPGSEREEHVNLKQQLMLIDNDMTLDHAEKQQRKQNLLFVHSQSGPISPNTANLWNMVTAAGSMPSQFSNTMSPNATSFYPAGDTVESVIGNALEEELHVGELSLSSIDRDLVRGGDNDNDTNSVCSSLSAGFPAAAAQTVSHGGSYLGATSVPVTIPSTGGAPSNNGNGGGGADYPLSLGSVSPSTSPLSSVPHGVGAASAQLQHQKQIQEQRLQGAASAFLSQPNPGKFPAMGYNSSLGAASDMTNSSSASTITPGAGASSMSPRGSVSQSPLLGAFANSMNGYSELQRLKEELAANKAKLQQWEEGMMQARGACEAWQKEAEEAKRRAKLLEDERIQAYKQRDEAIAKLNQQNKEIEFLRNNPYMHMLNRELETLPVQTIKHLQAQLIIDLDKLEKLVYQHEATKCVVCQKKSRSVCVSPCNHYVMCGECAARANECPYCKQPITQRSSMVLPAAQPHTTAPSAAPTPIPTTSAPAAV